MKYPFDLKQKFHGAGCLETRTLTAREAEALKFSAPRQAREGERAK